MIALGNKKIELQSPPFFIADIAANHDGDINRAYKLIELAKDAGADAAKFQNFKADQIVSNKGFTSMGGQSSHQKNWSKSVYEVYQDASLNDEWSILLKEKCEQTGIEYMTSPYDFHNVDLADQYSSCFKIGSGDITWLEILDYIAQKGKPVFLATGASDMQEVERAVQTICRWNKQLVLMQCNTNYTASQDNFKYINLNVLKCYQERYPDVLLGLSDHTQGHTTVLGAIALGARVIEKHFTDDNDRTGPDHKFSMNPVTWKKMVDESLNLFSALGDGIKKVEANEKETVILQRRGLYYQKNLERGHVLESDDIFPLRPCKQDSLLPEEKSKLIGKKIIREVQADDMVRLEDSI